MKGWIIDLTSSLQCSNIVHAYSQHGLIMVKYSSLPLEFGLGCMTLLGQWYLNGSEQRLKHALMFGLALWHRPSEQSQA